LYWLWCNLCRKLSSQYKRYRSFLSLNPSGHHYIPTVNPTALLTCNMASTKTWS
jgi:hypothetical protein